MPGKHRTSVVALSIFLFAFLVRTIFIVALGRDERLYDSLYDQNMYMDLAKSIVAGRGLSLTFDMFVADAYTPTSILPPGYPVVLALLIYLFGERYIYIRLFQVLLGSGASVLTYYIGRRATGEGAGLLAALAVSVYPPLVMYTRPIMSETLCVFLVSLIVLLLVRFAVDAFRPVHYLAWGGLFGVMFLVRAEISVTLALTIVPFVGWWALAQKRGSLGSLSLGISLASLAFIGTISPWVARNWYVHGEPTVLPNKRWGMWEQNALRYLREASPAWAETYSQTELRHAIPNFDDLSELERDRFALGIAKDFIVSHPDLYVRYAVSRLLTSYPIIPREELPPPVGYKGVRERPSDGFHPTSLDDFPLYYTGIEKLRVWAFRLVFVLAVGGLALAVKRRRYEVMVLGLPVLSNVGIALFLGGKERYRLPVDPYLILLGAYFLTQMVFSFRMVNAHRGDSHISDIAVHE